MVHLERLAPHHDKRLRRIADDHPGGPRTTYFVAIDADDQVGCIGVDAEPGEFAIYTLWILPPYRGRGLAGQLLSLGEELAINGGYSSVALIAEPLDEVTEPDRLNAFYHGRGYRPDPIQTGLLRRNFECD